MFEELAKVLRLPLISKELNELTNGEAFKTPSKILKYNKPRKTKTLLRCFDERI